MPITLRTDDFIIGYVFGKLERKLIEAIMHHDKEFHASVSVPKIWFGLKASKQPTITIPEHQISKLRIDLKYMLNAYGTNKTIFEHDIIIKPDEQFISFIVHSERVELVKEMTIKQIEKELGYKIKVVSDK